MLYITHHHFTEIRIRYAGYYDSKSINNWESFKNTQHSGTSTLLGKGCQAILFWNQYSTLKDTQVFCYILQQRMIMGPSLYKIQKTKQNNSSQSYLAV